MFQLPSFFKIRLIALIFGFFLLFFSLGFVRWCFASVPGYECIVFAHPGWNYGVTVGYPLNMWVDMSFTNGVVSATWDNQPTGTAFATSKNTSYASVRMLWGWNGSTWIQFPGTGSGYHFREDVLAEYASLANFEVDLGFPSTTLAALYPDGCPSECTASSYTDLIEECGGKEEYIKSYDEETCIGECYTCEEIETLFAPECSEDEKPVFDCVATPSGPRASDLEDIWTCEDCAPYRSAWEATYCTGPGLQVTSYNCADDTGTCEDCYQKESTWEATYCTGPGLIFTSYDCATDTGVCEDCGLKREAYEEANCTPHGLILGAYDCALDTGICAADDCAARRADWEATYCTGPGMVLQSFNCITNEGVCNDPESCESKQAAWEAAYCTGPGMSLTSYDCGTDTGVCDDPFSCADRQAAWESNYCNGPGLSLVSYDCVTDTGVCDDPFSCTDARNRWETTYCTGPGLVMTGFDCATGVGVCKDNEMELPPEVQDVSQFTERFSSFIDDLRASPLFALPSEVLGDIPAGGTSLFTVEMGSYGSMDLDLAEYSNIFAIVRSVLLVCFSFAALRIVVSKR